MADVFISYKREDRGTAQRLADALGQLGFDVWWDLDLLAGDKYRNVIRAVIDQCSAAIVLWSTRSIESDFVMDEASHAKRKGKLCPAVIDNVDLPFGFGQTHADDLTGWDGELTHAGFQALVRSLETRIGRKARLGAARRSEEAEALDAELGEFQAAQLASNVSALRTFLTRHPRGAFATFVRGQIEMVEAKAPTLLHSEPQAPQLPPEPSRETQPPNAPPPTPTPQLPPGRRLSWLWIVVAGVVVTALVFYGFHRHTQDEERARAELTAQQANLEQERKAREAAEARAKEMEAKAEQDRHLREQAERERLETQEAERQRLAREKKEQEQREAEVRRQAAAQAAAQAAKEKAAAAQAAKDKAMSAEADRKQGAAQSSSSGSARSSTSTPADTQSVLKQAQALERGKGIARDLTEAARLYRIAAEKGNAVAQYSLGRMYQYGLGVDQDERQASTWYRKAATQGNADAQYALGLAYAAGRGVPSDDVEARRWFDQAAIGFRRAADQGDMEAQQMLGHMMLYGRGVPKDEAEALKWFRRAADQGGALGQYYVGFLYSNGMGVPRDYSEAAKWYRKAADQGQVPAQFFLGRLYANGQGVLKDDAEAVKWFRKAAERGNRDAQNELTKRGLSWSR